MIIEEIKKALEDGNYRIEHEEGCCCSFDWDIVNGFRFVER